MKPRIYVLFVFDFDGECKFTKNKTIEGVRRILVSGSLPPEAKKIVKI